MTIKFTDHGSPLNLAKWCGYGGLKSLNLEGGGPAHMRYALDGG